MRELRLILYLMFVSTFAFAEIKYDQANDRFKKVHEEVIDVDLAKRQIIAWQGEIADHEAQITELNAMILENEAVLAQRQAVHPE